MSTTGAEIKKGKVGANALVVGDGVSAIIVGAPATTELANGIVTKLYNLVDAEKKGITPVFDKDNSVNLYRHVREFYRMAGEGQLLYVMLVPQATTMVQILEDTNNVFAKKLLIEAKGQIRQLAIAANPTVDTVHLNGLPTDVYNAIPKAQAFYDWADTNHMACNILLEAYDYSGDAASVAHLREIPNVKAENVSLVNGQDWRFADSLPVGKLQKFADVGTALGTLSACTINQNLGDNEAFNLTDAGKDAWLVPGLSSHQKNSDVFSDLVTLEEKAFIFGVEYFGMDGVRWNDDPTCTEIIRDAEGNINAHTIAYGRTHDKARRLLRNVMLPKVKTKQPVDPKNGKLPIGVIKHFENIGDGVFGDMEKRTEISFGKTIVDPESDLIVEKLLKVKFEIVPYGNIGRISGTSNLKSSI